MSAPGITSSSTAFSWPHETEFFDSFLKLKTSSNLSFLLSDDLNLCRFFDDIPFTILQRLADVDYRKSLIADRMYRELIDSPHFTVFGILGTVQALSHTVFGCISTKNFDELIPAAFLLVCFKYDYLQWIYPPTLPVCQ